VLSALLAACTATVLADDKRPANRLGKETSPYLLLHAHNPVDWYPWGPEAFARAKAEDKPVFLSVGYSSCYWCHVMERESFENAEIARFLNQRFVCVKVDREERPDVDQIYMNALQELGSGGWPMSMFLTPDGRPFFGGTYFPPRDRDGLTGFPSLLKQVAEAWRDHRPELERDASRLAASVRRSLAGSAARKVTLSRTLAAGGREGLAEQFDPEYAGFGFNPANHRRPKFPEPVNLIFLLDQHHRDRLAKKTVSRADPALRDPLVMVTETLDHMARGGIRDHLAGGYHRYAISRYWIVPHFEKMLYDNAQLASAHVLAFEATADPRWRGEAEDTFAFIARTMTAPEGGFYSALDAETEGDEGQYYVWTHDQVQSVIGKGVEYETFAQIYGLKRESNFEKGRYVLYEPRPRAEQAATLNLDTAALEARLKPLRAKLLAARDRRPAPLRDDKILTAWNGLMIAAYAEGFRVFKDERYRAAAEKAADFLLTQLRTKDGRLLRTHRAGQSKLAAYLEDYAFLTHGLLRLHAATGDPRRLAQARELTDRMIADFEDRKDGGFFYTADDHESLLARPKDPYDGAIPSANGVAVRNLVALASACGEPKYRESAGRALEAFSSAMAQNPVALPLMLVGLEEYLDGQPADKADAGLARVTAKNVVTAKASLARPGAAQPGREFDVVLNVTIQKGWHIEPNPAGSEFTKPTTVTLAPAGGAKLVKVDYPQGTLKKLAANDAPTPVYENEVKLTARIQLAEDARADELTLKLSYQACDDRVCLAPATLPVSVRLDERH
jgi:uncharacterized protein YyaL (SSP411 family)